MNRIFVGIDNGVTGAVAALAEDGRVVYLGPLPVVKIGSETVLDERLFRAQLAVLRKDYADSTMHVLVEPAQTFTPGSKALRSTWACWGAIRTVLNLEGYAWEPVNPQKWQRAMFSDHVRAVDQTAKNASIVVSQRLFPATKLLRTEKSRTPDSGLADALLIAEYGRRKR
jgi:hypothetical protein